MQKLPQVYGNELVIISAGVSTEEQTLFDQKVKALGLTRSRMIRLFIRHAVGLGPNPELMNPVRKTSI